MSIIPCQRDEQVRKKAVEFADVLKTEAHTLGSHGMSERDFYLSGILRGAIEHIRGEVSATMREKNAFSRLVLGVMQDRGFIKDWDPASGSNRYDYSVTLKSGRTAVIEAKGCLDGNNTTIFERPPHADEFILWSLCSNKAADPRKNAWSGIHTRLSSDIVVNKKRVDGLVIWDMLCGTIDRPCPKVSPVRENQTEVGQYLLPPPCIYVFPGTVPSPRDNPKPVARKLESIEILDAFHECFLGTESEVNYVDFEVGYRGRDIVRSTIVRRGGSEQRRSRPTTVRRV